MKLIHKNILYYLTFVTIYNTYSLPNKELEVSRSGVEELDTCAVGLKFFTVLNNTSDEDIFVELLADECCINSGVDLDCDSIQIVGESSGVIPRGTVEKLTLVAPILDPLERKGYCVINVDSRPVDRKNDVMRDTIKVKFDTRIKSRDRKDNTNIESLKPCKHVDEDPLNDCKPVDCDTYYNGKKSHYDKNSKRCVEIPNCNDKDSKDKIYNPVSNRCTGEEPVDGEDVDFIKSISKERLPKDVIIVETADQEDGVKYNTTVIEDDGGSSSNIETLYMDSNKTKAKLLDVKNRFACGSMMKYLTANKYTLLVLAIVIFVQCCLICTMVYCLAKKSTCFNKKKVERKYFNYRQDASVTTPLIGTSNIDTETTGFDYVTESTNVDKKIKCYKACQKERKNNERISLSDDILSKCLNRRDWNTKPKSETKDLSCPLEWVKQTNEINVTENRLSENVIRDVEKAGEEKQTKSNVTVEKVDNKKEVIDEDYETDSNSSEEIIQCHNYNMVESKLNNARSKRNFSKKEPSVSTEKGVQAYFSNDSIDDFLSERGMLFLAEENISKYSFASESAPNSSTEMSSKTSKNNIVKNVLSYLSRKSRVLTASDPGAKKKTKSKDLELIHMSRASVCSSTSEYKNIKGVTLIKDSRTSF